MKKLTLVINGRGGVGKELTVEQLADTFKRLEKQGVHNLNLVTPTHFTPQILQALDLAKPAIPVVMNCGGYERVETLHQWEGRVQVYLPDLKYADNALASRYSRTPDYFERALEAIEEMYQQTGPWQMDEETGILRSGVVEGDVSVKITLQNLTKKFPSRTKKGYN